jgi:hypothetical protein
MFTANTQPNWITALLPLPSLKLPVLPLCSLSSYVLEEVLASPLRWEMRLY